MKKLMWKLAGFVIAATIILAVTLIYYKKSSDKIIVPVVISPKTKVFFHSEFLDLETVRVNKEINILVPFENRGNNRLVIYDITSECGCTVPKWPEKPLPPGDTDTLKINFVAENQGAFRKSLSIFANTEEGPFIITITGFAVK